MTSTGTTPSVDPDSREVKDGEKCQISDKPQNWPEASLRRQKNRPEEDPEHCRCNPRNDVQPSPKPRVFADFDKKVQQRRRERTHALRLLKKQGRPGGWGGGRGSGNNSQPSRGNGLINDRHDYVLSLGRRPPVDLATRPVQQAVHAQDRHKPLQGGMSLSASAVNNQGTMVESSTAVHQPTWYEHDQSRERHRRRQKAFGGRSGGLGLLSMFDFAQMESDWDRHGHQQGASRLDEAAKNSGGKKVALTVAAGSTVDSAINLCDDDHSETDDAGKTQPESSKKRRKSDDEPQHPSAADVGALAGPRIRDEGPKSTGPARVQQVGNESVFSPHTTSPVGVSSDKGSEVTSGKNSGADVRKSPTLPSASGIIHSSSPSIELERATSPQATKKRAQVRSENNRLTSSGEVHRSPRPNESAFTVSMSTDTAKCVLLGLSRGNTARPRGSIQQHATATVWHNESERRPAAPSAHGPGNPQTLATMVESGSLSCSVDPTTSLADVVKQVSTQVQADLQKSVSDFLQQMTTQIQADTVKATQHTESQIQEQIQHAVASAIARTERALAVAGNDQHTVPADTTDAIIDSDGETPLPATMEHDTDLRGIGETDCKLPAVDESTADL